MDKKDIENLITKKYNLKTIKRYMFNKVFIEDAKKWTKPLKINLGTTCFIVKGDNGYYELITDTDCIILLFDPCDDRVNSHWSAKNIWPDYNTAKPNVVKARYTHQRVIPCDIILPDGEDVNYILKNLLPITHYVNIKPRTGRQMSIFDFM